jgi:hypothetical protein
MTLTDLMLACAVCFDGAGASRQAFIATTAFLTVLPLGMVAGAGVWLRKRARQVEGTGTAQNEAGEG